MNEWIFTIIGSLFTHTVDTHQCSNKTRPYPKNVTGWLVCLGGPPDVTVYLFEHMAYCLLLVPCALLSIV